MSWALLGVEMAWWMWILTLLSIVGVGVARASGEDDDLGDSTLGAVSWGVLLASAVYIAYLSYSASDVEGAISWIIGPGRVWVGFATLAYAGYIWQSVSGEVSGRGDMVGTLRERVTSPMLQVAGVVTTVLVTVFVALTTLGTVGGETLGFLVGMFADAPGFGAAVVTSALGFVGLGGSIPLLDAWIPDSLRGLSPAYYVALVVGVITLALSFSSTNFEEAVSR